MTIERATELQENMAKEAMAMLVIHGESIDIQQYEQCIALIGEAWDIPTEDTERLLSQVQKEKDAVSNGAAHVLPETELPMNATGMETLDNVWGLFETSLHFDNEGERTTLYNMARELAECQNLLDWIEQTPTEKQTWSAPTN